MSSTAVRMEALWSGSPPRELRPLAERGRGDRAQELHSVWLPEDGVSFDSLGGSVGSSKQSSSSENFWSSAAGRSPSAVGTKGPCASPAACSARTRPSVSRAATARDHSTRSPPSPGPGGAEPQRVRASGPHPGALLEPGQQRLVELHGLRRHLGQRVKRLFRSAAGLEGRVEPMEVTAVSSDAHLPVEQ